MRWAILADLPGWPRFPCLRFSPAAAGTTHISAWIRTNNVSISKNYIVEKREGGIDAVGTGFPAISRAALMVLPKADWQRLKDRLTFAAWEKKTEAKLLAPAK